MSARRIVCFTCDHPPFSSYRAYKHHCDNTSCGLCILSGPSGVAAPSDEPSGPPVLNEPVIPNTSVTFANNLIQEMMESASSSICSTGGSFLGDQGSVGSGSEDSLPPLEQVILPEPCNDTGDNVIKRSTTVLPAEIQTHMFVKPPSFDHDYLLKKIGTESGVKYGHQMFEKLQATEKSTIHLLNILRGKDQCLFDRIQKWRFSCHVLYGDEIRHRQMPPMRRDAISQVTRMYGYSNLKARTVEVFLPNTKKKTTLTVFPFGDMLGDIGSSAI
jgi:hypothetical protein